MKLVAHRGMHSKNTKENTFNAIMLGNKNKYIDAVEFDVRLSLDNEVVVIHDEVIDRVSNGSGKVSELSLERLKRYNYGTFIKRSTINTLDEILSKIDSLKLLVIELKDVGNKNVLLANRVLDIIKNYPNLNICLKSFSEEIIDYLIKHSNRPIGALINKNTIGLLDKDVSFYSISKDIVSSNMVNEKLKNNKKIMVWTVNTIEQINEIKNILNEKINDIYIISDNPLLFK